MYVVISGGGKVGAFLAKILTQKGHEVALIERRESTIKLIMRELPEEILIIKGDGCDVDYQDQAGVGRADVFDDVTGDDDDNLVACQIARTVFNAPRVVARVNNPKNEPIFHKMNIEAISSTTIISHLIEEEATISDLVTLRTLKRGELALVEVELTKEGCKLSGRKLRDINLPRHSVMVAILRGDEVIIPRGDTAFEAGDVVIAIIQVGYEEELKKVLRG